MSKPEAIGICLHHLVAREAAVINRVIAFSGSQGRNYYATDLAAAQIVIVSDDNPVDFSQMNPQGSMIVRIAAQDSAEPYDVLMMRPLLVTRVMRTLDEAHTLLSESLGDAGDVPDSSPELKAAVDTEIPGDAADTVNSNPEMEAETAVETATEVKAEEPTPELVKAVVGSQAQEVADPAELGSVTVINGGSENSSEPESSQTMEVAEPEEAESPVSQAEEATETEVREPVQTVAVDLEDDDESHYRALVVDDSAAIRKQLELELRDAGISADFAEDGEQAMEKVAANRYDLIFLDIIMPGIDGYETCRQMRTRAELKKTPIIMLSAKTSPLDEVQGVIAGASTYLTKPVKSEQLQSTLKRVSMWIDNFQVA